MYQLLVVSSGDMDKVSNDLYNLKNTTSAGRLMSILFNTEDYLEDRDGLYDLTTSDVRIVDDQLRLLVARLPQNG